jgi:hypothetical protein
MCGWLEARLSELICEGKPIMLKRIDQLPVILTSFAYREEYFSELAGMLVTVQQHHPNWHIVTGRGPLPGYATPTLEVESSSAKCHWSLPVSLDLDGSENDWYRIAKMKGWWLAQVWHNFGNLINSSHNRVLWLDADGRLNGPLDFEVEPESEAVAGVWWTDAGTPQHQHHVCGGLLMFQGTRNGIMRDVVDQWAAECIRSIALPLGRSQYLPGPETDQCLLTDVLKKHENENQNLVSMKLPYDKYCGVPQKDGTPQQGALVDQWMMNAKMRAPQDRNRDWPPPEAARRHDPAHS